MEGKLEPSSGGSGSKLGSAGHAQTVQRVDSIESTNGLHMTQTTSSDAVLVEGSSQLYVHGKDMRWRRRFVPMPTASPKDPLNLPTWRKAVIIGSLCFFGAMAFAPEAILAALLPVFVFEYAKINPKVLGTITGLPQAPHGGVTIGGGGLLGNFPGPPYWKVTLISTLPILVIGVSNYFTVPLSIAVGRRPVILVCGLLAWTGAIWAGNSTSLESHLGARALQAIGAGTVESLIPLIVQDLVFINWRNRCFSAVWASQGIIIVTLGICSPIIVVNVSWRWLYFITAILAAISWVVIIFTMPETRFFRTRKELRGEPEEPLPAGFDRPALNPTRYGRRTWRDEFGIFTLGFAWRQAGDAMLASIKSFFFPNIFWIILINGLFSAVSLAAGQTGAMVLLTNPYHWPFKHLGLAVLPIVIASFFVVAFAGFGADRMSNYITKKYFAGRREPEVHLFNLIVPLVFSIVGCIMFGVGGTYLDTVSWGVFVVGIGFLSFGLLSANVIFSTICVESYPDWAGPVLVNVASFRNIIGFGFSFKVTDWIAQLGFIHMFGIYAGLIAFLSLGLIPMYIYGKKVRKFCGRWVTSSEGMDEVLVHSSRRRVEETAMGRDSVASTRRSVKTPEAPRERSEKIPEASRDSKSAPETLRNSEKRSEASTPSETSAPPVGLEGRQGWAKVRYYLNMKDSWNEPSGH